MKLSSVALLRIVLQHREEVADAVVGHPRLVAGVGQSLLIE
jgi:hypothetical protein